jgi:serine/threonine protein kinase
LDVPPLRSQQPASSVIAEEIPIDGTFRYFKKGRFLGQGGFSKVYECVQQDTDEHFAIKVVPKEKRTLEMVSIAQLLRHLIARTTDLTATQISLLIASHGG